MGQSIEKYKGVFQVLQGPKLLFVCVLGRGARKKCNGRHHCLVMPKTRHGR